MKESVNYRETDKENVGQVEYLKKLLEYAWR